jgi:radical SAM superfamily enzyme YgiQ (UPF0313 family)
MKVLLINPPLKDVRNFPYPLGLLYISSYARKNCSFKLDISIIDMCIEDYDINDIINTIKSENYDVIGISFMTMQAEYVYNLTKLIKTECPNVIIVHGGVHPTLLPELSLDSRADFCVVGEGESEFLRILEIIKEGNKDIIDNKIFYGINNTISNISEIPYPAWDLIDISKYNKTIHVMDGSAASIIISRGCSNNCKFCCSSKMWRRRVRYRNINDVIGEIKILQEKYGFQKFHFFDEDLFMTKNRIRLLCENIVKEGLNINWVGSATINSIFNNLNNLNIISQSGCKAIEIGVESFSNEINLSMNKNQNLDKIELVCKELTTKNIIPILLLMNCLPGENLKYLDYKNRILNELIKKYKIRYVDAYTVPFPNTSLYNISKNNGVNLCTNWEDYSTFKPVFIPKSFIKDIPYKLINYTNAELLNITMKNINNDKFEREFNKNILYKMFETIDGKKTFNYITEELSTQLSLSYNELISLIYKFSVNLINLGLISYIEKNKERKVSERLSFEPISLYK